MAEKVYTFSFVAQAVMTVTAKNEDAARAEAAAVMDRFVVRDLKTGEDLVVADAESLLLASVTG